MQASGRSEREYSLHAGPHSASSKANQQTVATTLLQAGSAEADGTKAAHVNKAGCEEGRGLKKA